MSFTYDEIDNSSNLNLNSWSVGQGSLKKVVSDIIEDFIPVSSTEERLPIIQNKYMNDLTTSLYSEDSLTKLYKPIKRYLISLRNSYIDSFFYDFNKEMKKEVAEIDAALDKIEMHEYYRKEKNSYSINEAIDRIEKTNKKIENWMKELS